MDDVCQHGRREILTEHMYLSLERALNKLEHPLDQPPLIISRNQTLLNRTFLQDPKTEPLRNIAIILLQQYLDNLLNNNIIVIIRNILDALHGRYDDRDQGGYGVF